MVEFYTTVFLKNIPQFVIPKQNKIMQHSEELVSHSEDVYELSHCHGTPLSHTLSFSFPSCIHTVVLEPTVFHYLTVKSGGLGVTHRLQQLDAFTVWCIPMCMKIGTSFPL